MSKLLELAKAILLSAELAADNIEVLEAPTVEEQYIAYLGAALLRANKFLDSDKTRIFADVLNLPTKGKIERAVAAYDRHFLMSLGLSLESTSELAKELIQVAKNNNVQYPNAWRDIAAMDMRLTNPKITLLNRKRPVV